MDVEEVSPSEPGLQNGTEEEEIKVKVRKDLKSAADPTADDAMETSKDKDDVEDLKDGQNGDGGSDEEKDEDTAANNDEDKSPPKVNGDSEVPDSQNGNNSENDEKEKSDKLTEKGDTENVDEETVNEDDPAEKDDKTDKNDNCSDNEDDHSEKDDKTKTEDKNDNDEVEKVNDEETSSPSKNLRKRKVSESVDGDIKDSKEPSPKTIKIQPKPSDKAAIPVSLGTSAAPVVSLTYNVNQPVTMVLPSTNILTSSGQPFIISQPQTSLLSSQGVTLNTGNVVLYPQLKTGSVATTTTTLNVNNSSVSLLGSANDKSQTELRTPSSSTEMIELVKWEMKAGVHNRPKNYKLRPDSELGPMARFLRDFGQDLVKELVYSDLVDIQSRRSDHGKLTDKEKKDFQKLKSVHAELKDKVGPLRVDMNKKCKKCGFETESTNVMYWHNQHAHVDGNDINCSLCDFETRDSNVFKFHMEAEHNRKALFVEKRAFWSCNLCPYETQLRNKLNQHRIRCMKTFKMALNLHPCWLPGPETNYCLEKIFYKNPMLANMQRLQQQKQQRLQLQQQQQQQRLQELQKQQRNGTLIMPKGGKQVFVQGGQIRNLPINQMNKGALVNTQPIRNQNLLARLGTNQNQSRNIGIYPGNKLPNLAAHLNSADSKKMIQRQGAANTKMANMTNNVQGKPSGFEVCEICGGYVKDRTALRIHFFYAHRIDMPHGVFDRVHPPLYCATCFARFWTAQGLQKHLDVHKEDSSGGVAGKCIVCLHRVPNILMHMKIVHNKAFVNFLRECKCIFCGLKFPYKHVVESHMASVHGVVVKSGSQAPAGNAKQPANTKAQVGGKKPQGKGQKGGKGDLVKGSVCVLCNLNFGRNVDLTRHCMRVHHTCMKCGMVVADKESLMRHKCLDSPSGLRNCELCREKGFHPAYHVKHIRDKHLKKLSIKVKRLDRKTYEKWAKKPAPWQMKKVQNSKEPIELSDDEEPSAKRAKVDDDDEIEIIEPKKVEPEIVMLSDDDEEEKKEEKKDEKTGDEKKEIKEEKTGMKAEKTTDEKEAAEVKEKLDKEADDSAIDDKEDKPESAEKDEVEDETVTDKKESEEENMETESKECDTEKKEDDDDDETKCDTDK